MNRRSLWERVISGCYNLNIKPTNCLSKKTLSRVWNNIFEVKKHLQNFGTNIDDIFAKTVGKGDDTLFWFDKWMGPVPLKTAFPELYYLERRKHCKVVDKVSSSGYS